MCFFGIEDLALCGVSDPGIAVEGQDFSATFDPVMRSWTAKWKWSQNSDRGGLQNQIESYSVPCEARVMYDCKLEKWIVEGWLTPYEEEKYRSAKGQIPLMAVIPKNKVKVRPVLDYRELNTSIDAFTADADVCSDKMREWRREGENVSLIDLKKAYLQIHIHDSVAFSKSDIYGAQVLSNAFRIRCQYSAAGDEGCVN